MLNDCSDVFLAGLEAQIPGVLRTRTPRDSLDPRGRWHGIGGARVACPRTRDEVAALVRACAAARVGIVPLGGGTGLVGGHIKVGGAVPLLLSLERLNKLRGVFPADNVLEVEAGMILAHAQEEAAKVGRLFPLSLASEGTLQIGGALAVNAGGVNVLRYGNARDVCLGLEAVLPDGRIMHGLKRLRKDNTGYDVRNLLIGSEGSLGIITAATLRLFTPPASYAAALIHVTSPTAALALLALAEEEFSGMVCAFELINRTSFDFLNETIPQLRIPLTPFPEWSVLIDLGVPPSLHAARSMSALYAKAEERALVENGVIASSEAQRRALWTLRESIPTANRLIGAISSHDISLPPSCVPEFTRRAPQILRRLGEWRINCFGHLGDGNLHYNVFPLRGQDRKDHEAQRASIKDAVHDLVHEMGGSISAEHGIGRLKVDDLERYSDPVKLAVMRKIKQSLDPDGIMNPGAVLRGA